MVCLASTGKEFDAETSLRVEYLWYPGEYQVRCKLFIFLENSITIASLKFFFEGGGIYFSTPPKTFHENRTPHVENTLVLAD